MVEGGEPGLWQRLPVRLAAVKDALEVGEAVLEVGRDALERGHRLQRQDVAPDPLRDPFWAGIGHLEWPHGSARQKEAVLLLKWWKGTGQLEWGPGKWRGCAM